LRHTRRQLQPIRHDVTYLETLASMSQKGADQPSYDCLLHLIIIIIITNIFNVAKTMLIITGPQVSRQS